VKIDWKKRALAAEKDAEKFRKAVASQLELIVWSAKEQNFGLLRDRAEYLLNRVQRHQTIVER